MGARLVTVGGVMLYLLVLVALGGHGHWGRLGVSPGTRRFEDLRSVTTGWECTRRGIPVLARNPCDPLKRPANYPQIWMRLSFLKLDHDVVALGVVVVAIAALAALSIVPAEAPSWTGVVYAGAICSPAVMLGFERGNVDLLLFAFVVAAALVLRCGIRGSVAAHGLILAAAILKLFPIFAAGMFVRRLHRRRDVALLVGLLGAFAVYALMILSEIRTIGRVVPQTDLHSYGVHTSAVWWSTEVPPHSARFWGLSFVAAAAVLALAFPPRLRPDPSTEGESEQRDLDLFWAGASVYVLTFVLFQSFDYRLIFLLATLPQLLRWSIAGSRFAVTTLAFIFLTLWLASPWTGVPVLGWVESGWRYLTAFHPVASYNPLSAAATAQLLLSFLLVAALAGSLPMSVLPRRR
jgi:hypothetical protein